MARKRFLPPRWFIVSAWRYHRRMVRRTDGRRGLWPPAPDKWGALKLTTTGRRTGEPRSVILAYVEDDPNLVCMAMNGWGPEEPSWWLNLQSHDEARVELDGNRELVVRAHRAVGAERVRLWSRWSEIDKHLDDYAARRPRETAIVVLEPVAT